MVFRQGRGKQRIARLPDYPTRNCEGCGSEYAPWKINQRFCSKPCQSRVNAREYYVRTHGKPPDPARPCLLCGSVFPRRDRYDWRRQYCSDACRKEGRRRVRQRFMSRNPGYKKREEVARYGGWSSTVTRFFRRHPDIQRACMSCGEARVVDIHHKERREGVPVRAGNSKREHVWVLCPNHHAMLHRGVATPESLGLA